MKDFWGFVKNEKYSIGCTGQTTYVYDAASKEIAKFKEIKYAYEPMFCPCKNMFVVKSTDGWLAFYSLDTMQLLKKVHFSKVGAQDEGFCFSPDGRYLFNIEKPVTSIATELAIYETDSFQILRRLFQGERTIVISHIEYDSEKSAYFVLGFCRDNEGVFSYGFVSELCDNRLINTKRIPDKEYDYLAAYKRLELKGFTKKSIEWSALKNRPLTHMKISDAQL
jgi:hypothetical protein